MRKKSEQFVVYIKAAAFIAVGILLDQWVKHLSVLHLKAQENLDLLPGVFQLTYLENRGAAFGLFQNQRPFFLICTALVLCVFALVYGKIPPAKRFLPFKISMLLIAAGAAGNLIDRIRFGCVIDMFYFQLIDFPVFNVADIFVTVGTILLMSMILFYYKEEDFDQIFHRRGKRKRIQD